MSTEHTNIRINRIMSTRNNDKKNVGVIELDQLCRCMCSALRYYCILVLTFFQTILSSSQMRFDWFHLSRHSASGFSSFFVDSLFAIERFALRQPTKTKHNSKGKFNVLFFCNSFHPKDVKRKIIFDDDSTQYANRTD